MSAKTKRTTRVKPDPELVKLADSLLASYKRPEDLIGRPSRQSCALAAVLGLLAVAQEISYMSFLLGFAACVIAAVGAWVSIALRRPLIGIEIERRSPQVS